MNTYRRFYINLVMTGYGLSICILSSCSHQSSPRTVFSPAKKDAAEKAEVSVSRSRHGGSMGHSEERKAAEEQKPLPTIR